MPTVNQEADRIVKGMKKNQHRFKELYGSRDKEVMYATANKLAQKKQVKQRTWKSGQGFKEETMSEAKCEKRYCRLCRKKETRKQCGFGGVMWDRYAVKDASDSERQDAAEESGISEGGEGVTNGMGESLETAVLEGNKSGDSSLRDWFSKSKSSDGKPGWVQLGGKYAGKPCAKQPGQTTKPKCGSSKMKRNLNKDEEEAAFRRKNAKDPNPDRKGKAINVKTESYEIDPKKHRVQQRNAKIRALARKGATEGERSAAERKTKGPKMFGEGDFWHPDPDKDRKLGGPGANQRAREDRAASSKPKSDPKKLRPGESYMEYAKRMKTRKEDCWDGYEKKGMKTMFGKKYPNCVKKTKTKKEEVELTAEGKGEKDACYKKVKSRYSVWPSAYASGALVKCRKVGAANWGNKSKKEEFEGNLSFSQFNEKAKSCWDTHKKVGMKMKGGKLVNDCRPKNEEVTNEGAAWTKKAGKNSEGGLNEKGRKSYERENPGSDLKAPSKKVGNPRRASFCARMRGMKKKLTSKKTASDPDSRINKSLRAWNC